MAESKVYETFRDAMGLIGWPENCTWIPSLSCDGIFYDDRENRRVNEAHAASICAEHCRKYLRAFADRFGYMMTEQYWSGRIEIDITDDDGKSVVRVEESVGLVEARSPDDTLVAAVVDAHEQENP